MLNSVDYSDILTWEKMDLNETCLRISQEPQKTGYHIGALVICKKIYDNFEVISERCQFFFNCEKLGLRGWKVYTAHKNYCNGSDSVFIRAVLKSDESMMKMISEKEKEMN